MKKTFFIMMSIVLSIGILSYYSGTLSNIQQLDSKPSDKSILEIYNFTPSYVLSHPDVVEFFERYPEYDHFEEVTFHPNNKNVIHHQFYAYKDNMPTEVLQVLHVPSIKFVEFNQSFQSQNEIDENGMLITHSMDPRRINSPELIRSNPVDLSKVILN